MRVTQLGQLWRAVPVVTALLVAGHARPAEAAPCFSDLGRCYQAAAAIDSFWWRAAAGADCEIDFGRCLREAWMGW